MTDEGNAAQGEHIRKLERRVDVLERLVRKLTARDIDKAVRTGKGGKALDYELER